MDVQEVGFGYIKTLPGIIKIAQQVFNFIGCICIISTGASARGDAFLACSIIALVVTGILLVSYVTKLVLKISVFPWYRVEFFFSALWAIFYIIVSSLVIDTRAGGYIAGGVFGLIATFLYIGDAYLKFRLVMS